jgi:hypothetical protein
LVWTLCQLELTQISLNNQSDALVWQEQTNSKSYMGLIQGCTDFPKSKPPENFRHQNSDIKQVPYWGSTNIRYHHTKFSNHANLLLGICAPLV